MNTKQVKSYCISDECKYVLAEEAKIKDKTAKQKNPLQMLISSVAITREVQLRSSIPTFNTHTNSNIFPMKLTTMHKESTILAEPLYLCGEEENLLMQYIAKVYFQTVREFTQHKVLNKYKIK